MTTSHSTEERISQWLEEAAVGQLPDRVLDATFETTRGLAQARASAWRPFTMSRPIPAMVAVGAAVIIAAAGVIYFRPVPGSNVGSAPPASPSPTTSATPGASASPSLAGTTGSTSSPPLTIDTSGWQAFSSGRHGYTIRHPVDRRVRPANAPLTYEFLVGREGEPFLGGDPRFVAVYDDMYDTFAPPDPSLYPIVGVTSTKIPDGMTEDEWLATYGRAHNRNSPCLPPRSEWDTVMIDDVPSGLYRGCGFIEALSFVSGRAYTFSVTRGMGGAPDVDSELLRAFLSTVIFHPELADDTP
jgi:hypothetical protein